MRRITVARATATHLAIALAIMSLLSMNARAFNAGHVAAGREHAVIRVAGHVQTARRPARSRLKSGWRSLHSGTTAELLGVTCLTARTCYVLGEKGTLLATTTGGASWRKQASHAPYALYSMACPTARTCDAVGTYAILLTTNGGSTWRHRGDANTGLLGSISCPRLTVCYAVGQNGTITTLYSVTCAGSAVCYAVGDKGLRLKQS